MTRRSASTAAPVLLPLMLLLLASCCLVRPLEAQQQPGRPAAERGANALGELLEGLGTTARVLMIGAHPDDEDTQLITWLARGRHVETSYLSLTRGDGGQNLIGNELGEALGVVRTEELLAARRVDGAGQYFTRAYDFGFSKSAEETWTHWPHHELLGDVVRAVRATRPHVVVAVFSGTRQDGHGHHEASGILAREAYDLAGDTVRFPVARFGPAWTVPKFYRAARFRREGATLAMNVGEYDAVLGRSYAEIAAESRSQHRSQAFGALQLKGVVMDYVTREASRVNAGTDAKAETGLFDGVDTTLVRLASAQSCSDAAGRVRALAAAIGEARRNWVPSSPGSALPALSRVSDALDNVRCLGAARPAGELDATMTTLRSRLWAAQLAASGVAVEAESEREVVAIGDTMHVRMSVYNRGRRPVTVEIATGGAGSVTDMLRLAPDSAASVIRLVLIDAEHAGAWVSAVEPWWLARPRRGDMYGVAATDLDARGLAGGPRVGALIRVSGESAPIWIERGIDIVRRVADPIQGDVSRPVRFAPAITLTLDRSDEYAPAGAPLDRTVRVTLRSATNRPRSVRVSLALPKGLTADSAARSVALVPDGTASVVFRVRGRLREGRHEIRATATSDGETYERGYVEVEYEHIRPQRLYRPAVIAVQAVTVRVPAGLTVAYLPGVGDNSAPALRQLGIPVTVLEPAQLATADFSAYQAVVVGPRFWEAHPGLRSAASRLQAYARRGGTVVVQYGQYEMAEAGLLPYPVTLARPAQRVTDEGAPVRMTDAAARVLVAPNRITAADFSGWVQDRTLYMPTTIDPRWSTPLSVNDPGEPAGAGALLVAPVGRGMYVYTTLAFFRQLPAGVPGAARLFVNLLAAGSAGGAAGAATEAGGMAAGARAR